MTTDTYWQKISAYLSGDLSEAERISFESWLQESDENRHLFGEAKKIWDSSGIKRQLKVVDTEAELARLYTRIEREKRNIVSLFFQGAGWKIAASILVLIIATYILWPSRHIYQAKTDEVILTAGEQVLTVYLPDSSRVWLNRHSRISYPKNFNTATRNVTLDGEGYFLVKRNASKPFTVATRSTATVVLGTSFNVKEEDSLTTLTVAEGKVRFSSAETEANNAVQVTPNEQATYSTRKKAVDKSPNRNTHFAAWRKRHNPMYDHEQKYSASYLSTRYTWRKNPINQSVIDGRITNKASLATYRNIVLAVTYSRSGGPRHTTELVIGEKVKPGQTIDYRRRLLDIFTDTSYLHVQVKSAEITDDEY
ncbi:MAG TPA: FecR domain-containing protein [Ohtaekwangia sp.]|uniref:FecR domain-containing protein n=1 Tax=Ohtaekwangia sp. TaxID=2066019 RepID=UPI002F93F03A